MKERPYAVEGDISVGFLLRRNGSSHDFDILRFKYISDEDKLDKLLENQQLIKTPVVRNGKKVTVGYQPDVWKGWN